MSAAPASNVKLANPALAAWRTLRAWLISALLAVGIAATLSIPNLSQGQVTLKEGDVAQRDVRAPGRITYISKVLTNQAREEAAAAVALIYTPPDPAIARAQVARARQMLDFIRAVRADPLAPPAEKTASLRAIEGLNLSRTTIEQILAQSNESWGRVEAETIAVIDLGMRREISDAALAETRSRVPALVGTDLNDAQTQVVIALATPLMAPNSFYDAAATSTAQDQARAAIKEVTRTYEAGQVVVREGAIVTALDIEALENLNLLQPHVEWTFYLGNATLAILITLIVVAYIHQFEPELRSRPRHQMLLVALAWGFMAAVKIIIPGHTVLPYLLPTAALPMLIAVLVSPGLAALTAVMMSGVVGLLANESLELAAYTCASGLVAAMTLVRVERLSAFFRAGIYSALANVAIVVAFRLSANNTDLLGIAMLMGSGIIAGSISAALAMAALFIIGGIFDMTTTLQLLELARPTHPLLNQLLMQATGTYHHMLMVANLAEQAAEQIGANALLSRVGAMYHDIGKMARPYMFVENQIGKDNIHDRLDPLTSSEIIMSHIKDGQEMARRHHLPSRVRAFIPEHHGTMRASFLYHKAVERAGGDASKVDENAFRYPGPKPQSKETALIMLADGCEAAVRAKQPQTQEELAEVISQIIADRLADSQLDECPLTLRDLEIIRASFIHTLQGMFHPRLEYPELKRTPTTPARLPPEQANQPMPANNHQEKSDEQQATSNAQQATGNKP